MAEKTTFTPMVRVFVFVLAFFPFGRCLIGQEFPPLREKDELLILFYNVENLFDTIDHPRTLDSEFLPAGKKEWNSGKYYHKLNQLSKVILNAGGQSPPEIFGLCEVENEEVVQDLIKRPALRNHPYEIIFFPSKDPRGISNALVYKTHAFFPFDSLAIPVKKRKGNQFTTRDILKVSGILFGGDTISFYVNHWSSRRGGQVATDHKRIQAAQVLLSELSKERMQFPNRIQIIMGDFNDGPKSKSLTVLDSLALYSCFVNANENFGTHYYKGYWEYLDHFLVYIPPSSSWLGSDCEVYLRPWMMETNSKNQVYPKRSWQGPVYLGGFSDHLPIYLKLEKAD